MISVIIPTYNRAAMLAYALRSVSTQTFCDYEVIVVDDGSTDDTRHTVSAAGMPVRYLWQVHSGVSAARNRGVGAARGEWIAFLDSDDRWLPAKLKRQMAFVQSHGDVVACQTEEIWIRNGVRVNPGKRHRKPSGDIFLPSLELCLVSPSAVLLRRATFERLGGFDEGLPACEDYDLWLRLAVDTPVYLVADPLTVRYGGHPDQLSRRYWGLDRFRVIALSRLLSSGVLDPERRACAALVLTRKCEILAGGARRRGRVAEAEGYVEIARCYTDGCEGQGRPDGVRPLAGRGCER